MPQSGGMQYPMRRHGANLPYTKVGMRSAVSRSSLFPIEAARA
jgi:hypothetical protein